MKTIIILLKILILIGCDMERNSLQQNQSDIIPIHFKYKHEGNWMIEGEIAEWEQNPHSTWKSKNQLSLLFSYINSSNGRIKSQLVQELFTFDAENIHNIPLPLFIKVTSSFRPESLIFKKKVNNVEHNSDNKFLSKDITLNGIPLNQFNYKVKFLNKVTGTGQGMYHLLILEINTLPIGLQLCDQIKFPIHCEIKSLDWKKMNPRNNFWSASLNLSEKTFNLSKDKNDHLGSFYQFNAGDPKKNGIDLYVKIFSMNSPAKLDFVLKRENTTSTGDFILFTDLKQCFTLNGKMPIEIKNDNIFIHNKLYPAITLNFPDEEQTVSKMINNNEPEIIDTHDNNQIINIGILPFSVILSDEVKERIQPDTIIDQIRSKFVSLLINETNLNIENVSYPQDIDPFSRETIDIVPPTLKKGIINTPEKILTGICKIQNKNKLIIGHIEEDLIHNQLILCVRLFDCTTQEMISLPVQSDLAGDETFTEKSFDKIIAKLFFRFKQVLHKFAI